jgi:acyl-CoA thioesterase FadM
VTARADFPHLHPLATRLDDNDVAFRDAVEVGLRARAPAATGWFVHVFVGRERRQAVEIPAGVRSALERLIDQRTSAG